MSTAKALNIFDIWRPGYAGAVVTIYNAGTTTKTTLYDGEDTGTAGTISNPVTLDTLTIGDVSHGKWTTPVYVTQDVELSIDGETTGIFKFPVLALAGEDVSQAEVTLSGESTARDLRDWAADVVWAAFYGSLTGSAAVTTATINAAIGAASAAGGGKVLLPAGTFTVNANLAVSAGVTLEGQGRTATVIQAQMAAVLVSLQGTGAGLRHLTLDGVNKTAGSTGVEIDDQTDVILDDVMIKRFVTGLDVKGLVYSAFHDLYVSTCTTGVQFKTDSGAGDKIEFVRWFGGMVDLCTTVGVLFEHGDDWVHAIDFYGTQFDDNTGTAIKLVGAQAIGFHGCSFDTNTTLLDVDDVTTPSGDEDDLVIGLTFEDFYISGGNAAFDDTCKRVTFRRGEIAGGTWTITSAENNILLEDVTEASAFSLSGTATRVVRKKTANEGYTVGQTTGSSATKAWAETLKPGQVAMLTAKVTAVRQDADAFAAFTVRAGARRPPAQLDYDTQSANFTAGATLTGGTSGATATIVKDDDSGTTGTLHLINIIGTFENNETITDGSGGSALVNGTITEIDAIVGRGIRDDIGLVFGTDRTIAADFAASASEVEFQVTGASSETWDWRCDVEALVS